MKTQSYKALYAFIVIILTSFTQPLIAQTTPTITAVGGGAALTRMSANPADPNYSIIYQVNVPANQSVNGVSWAGDIVVTLQPTTYPVFGGATGTSFTVTVESRNNGRETSNTCNNYLQPANNHLGVDATNWGFAKGRLTVSWNNGTCGDYVSLDIFKSFALHPPIIGPKCIKVGDKITFSACNILSGHNTPPTLGQDKYYWTGDPFNNYDNANYPPGLNYLYSSADGSSITFKVDDYTFIGAKLYCRFGQCNFTTVSDVTLSAITFPPTFQLWNSNGSSMISANQVDNCIDATGAFSTILLKIFRPNTPAGPTLYNYELSSNNFGWGFGNSSTPTYSYSTSTSSWSQTANIGTIGGEIYLKTSNANSACDTWTDIIKIGRNIVGATPAFKIIEDPQLGGTCIVSGQTGGYTLTPYPGNLPISWNYPPSWAPQGSTNGPTLRFVAGYTTLVGAAVTAKIGGCTPCAPYPVYVKPSFPTSPPASFTYNGTNYASGTPVCVPFSTNPQTFTVNGGSYIVSYVWTPPIGWTGSSNTNQITVAPNLTTAGNLIVKGSADPPGNTCVSSNAFVVTAYAPVLNAITGPTCLRAGNPDALTLGAALTSNVTYSVTGNFPTGTTYQWTVPLGIYVSGSLSSTTGTSVSFTCNGVPSATPYTILVTATKGNCSTTASISVSVDLRNDILNSTITSTPSQKLELVLNGGGQDNTISNYQWFKWSSGQVSLSAPSNFSLDLANLYGFGTGNYGVEATYTNGCKNVFAITSTSHGYKMGNSVKTKTAINSNKAVTINKNSAISLQPNPARSSVTVTLPNWKANMSISVIDIKGNLLFKKTALAQRLNINTASWANGEYTVIVREANGKTISKKLVVQNH